MLHRKSANLSYATFNPTPFQDTVNASLLTNGHRGLFNDPFNHRLQIAKRKRKKFNANNCQTTSLRRKSDMSILIKYEYIMSIRNLIWLYIKA